MQQVKPKYPHLGLIIVVSTLAVLMLILITAIAIFLYTTQVGAGQPIGRSLLTSSSPLNRIEVDQVDPALALASLGGVSEADVIAEAISKKRPETALAAILYSPFLADKESAGDLLLLAESYINNDEPDKAIFSYQLAGTTATLSPNMPDTVRGDIFLQASEGLMKLSETALAKFYLDQAFVLASKSPFLQAAHRRSILERLQKNYITLGERELARESLNLSANPSTLNFSTPLDPILPGKEAIPLPAQVQEMEANRWRRAQELAAILVERGGRAPQSAIDALRDSLINEDRQKLLFYEGELATAARLTTRINITLAQIEWLTVKYRVARRAVGMSLVPEWESQVEQIRADLTKSYETLFALYADLIVAMPEVSKIDKATEERLRREILAGEYGRYPNYPEDQRQQQLLDATSQLITSQNELTVFVGVDTVAGEERYTLTATNQ